MLVLANFRPEFRAEWVDRPECSGVHLSPLADGAVDQLLTDLLGDDPNPELAELARTLRERTGGNPFFVEEIVRALAGDGTLAGARGGYRLVRSAAEVRVPPTVHGVLAARVDRLPARDKTVLQAAAVIGRTFNEPVLRALLKVDAAGVAGSLAVLRDHELIQSTGVAGESRFWHPLTQEVAYGSLVAPARRRLHRRVAEALVASDPVRHDELAALIATHYQFGADALNSARWQLRAGMRAMRGDYVEASSRLNSVLEHLDAVPPSELSRTLGLNTRAMLLRLGARTGMDRAQAEKLFAAASEAAGRLGSPALSAGLSMTEGIVRILAGETMRARAAFAAARDGAASPAIIAWAAACESVAISYTGSLPEGEALLDIAADLCGQDRHFGAAQVGFSVYDLVPLYRALIRGPGGRLDEARADADRAIAGYAERPMAQWRIWGLAQLARLMDWTGEHTEQSRVRDAMEIAARLVRDTGDIGASVVAAEAVGLLQLCTEDTSATATFQSALHRAREHRAGLLIEASLLSHLARARLADGNVGGARTAAAEALEVAQRQGAHVLECLAHTVQARIWRTTADGPSDRFRAAEAVAAGMALAHRTGAATYEAFLGEEHARLNDDRTALEGAVDAYAAIGASGHARRVRAELADH